MRESDGSLGIHEVHYEKDGTASSWTEDPIIVGDDIEDLRSSLKMIERALDCGVLSRGTESKNVAEINEDECILERRVYLTELPRKAVLCAMAEARKEAYAVAFGLMGMAMAIEQRQRMRCYHPISCDLTPWVEPATTGSKTVALPRTHQCMGTVPGSFVICGERFGDVAAYCSDQCMIEGSRNEGAAVAFGLMGMAEAIRRNGPPLVERHYFVSELDGVRRYTCYCPGCGAYMKRLTAGEDEGTDNEWCGACRYG